MSIYARRNLLIASFGPNVLLTQPLTNGQVLVYDAQRGSFVNSPGSELFTASNHGTGVPVFDEKVGSDFEFNTLVAGPNVTINKVGNNINIAANVAGAGIVLVVATKADRDALIPSLTDGSMIFVQNDERGNNEYALYLWSASAHDFKLISTQDSSNVDARSLAYTLNANSPTVINLGDVSPGSRVVDAKGRVTSAAAVPSGTGSVTSVVAGAGLTGGTITNSGTIALGTVSNSNLAPMAANTIKGNALGSSALPNDIPLAPNTFLSRSSSGNIAANTISDTGITLVGGANATVMRGTIQAAGTSQPDFISGQIKTPDTNIIWLCMNVPYAFTVTSIAAYCQGGSATVGIYNGAGNALMGTQNATTSGYANNTSLANNSVAAGGSMFMQISSISSCSELWFEVDIVRTLQ
jgi:hypothetical protein